MNIYILLGCYWFGFPIWELGTEVPHFFEGSSYNWYQFEFLCFWLVRWKVVELLKRWATCFRPWAKWTPKIDVSNLKRPTLRPLPMWMQSWHKERLLCTWPSSSPDAQRRGEAARDRQFALESSAVPLTVPWCTWFTCRMCNYTIFILMHIVFNMYVHNIYISMYVCIYINIYIMDISHMYICI